ncbi:1-phosphatidylinositol 3-phosphate 5-kinase [Rhynchospora pubera]|uniref:1-phosphatidylinositol-3-phosphate 5-kinase n=1 Tax=Rhynchospora pubera TaxID=906938 RepID=A0AAV8GA91_9POAL|nr:1-phosphatidylinositol 3-phosphate 5-kinase [Rhynchospora pubera]
MGVSDLNLKDLVHKVRSIMAELTTPPSKAPETTGLSSVDRLTCYDFAMEMDQDVTGSGPNTPESDVLRSGRSKAAHMSGRQLFSSPSPIRCSVGRSIVEEDDDESYKQFFRPIGENLLPEFSDSDSSSMTDSPTRDEITTPKSDRSLLLDREYSPDFDCDSNKIWLPPGPDDETDEEMGLFDETEDKYEIGFDSDSSFIPDDFDAGLTEVGQESSRGTTYTHFRALVSQLLNGEGFNLESENYESYEGWVEIVSSLVWQAANFVKPDTKGGSMDPGDFVKVKCIASGKPTDSKFIKGVVCSKNVKHKRMVSQHVNPRLLLVGGSLEYQKVSNKLASLNNVLQQEKDHLKTIVEKISALKPHVLLVEKSVSPYAQEILANEISLVLNMKRPLLERISRCTGAQIVSSADRIRGAQLGGCRAFYVQKFTHHPSTKSPKCKTLMFFEGCPRRLGCTVLLRGPCSEELKRVKHVVQLAVFAAYHLALETSYLADEGSSMPQFPSSSNDNEMGTDDQVLPFCEQNEQLHRPKEGNINLNITNNDRRINNTKSMLVSMSSRCVPKGMACEWARLLRIKFYGPSDKPLGRYLCEDLFNERLCCDVCKEPSQAHVRCYRHQQGSLTIRVRRLTDVQLPGERDGKIWMWHRCLRCDLMDSIPPATQRVVMSRAAWGLSFGKFLELSFSNHTSANRIAPCGHSLPKDCLRFYGFGSMVALFQYSSTDILSVSLPPPVLDLTCDVPQEWIRREAEVIYGKVECLHAEVSDLLCQFENNSTFGKDEPLTIGAKLDLIKLKDMLKMERNTYDVLLQPLLTENFQPFQSTAHFMELNRLKRDLLIDAFTWDHRLCQIDMVIKAQCSLPKPMPLFSETLSFKIPRPLPLEELGMSSPRVLKFKKIESIAEIDIKTRFTEGYLSPISDPEETSSCTSCLSDQIESAWTGSNFLEPKLGSVSPIRNTITPVRVHSFNSSLGLRQRVFVGPSSDYPVEYMDSFGNFPNMRRALSHRTPGELENSNILISHSPLYVTSLSSIRADKARLLLPQIRYSDVPVAVYDDEPTSIISHALTLAPAEAKENHVRISFEDECALPGNRAKFSVICYFAKQFEKLRRKCCEVELDYVRSLCRCKRWSAKGGKSNVYFAKTLDERFVVKQVTRTELEAFEEFAPQYFKYVNGSLVSDSPTCLAKIVGIYQVSAKNIRGGRELKMDLMVMENIFFKRNISRVYDLKGSLRSRYNSDTSGVNRVLLDENLLEALKKKPIFLGCHAKRQLERAVWNDTSFLSSVNVMDYSLLVGIDEEQKELVIGIIDFMRQYTWDKQLETWVKASGILGGPKNTSPTIISPIQYKKRFRKAMSQYFVTLPDCWC